jgi:hypothetical protein
MDFFKVIKHLKNLIKAFNDEVSDSLDYALEMEDLLCFILCLDMCTIM